MLSGDLGKMVDFAGWSMPVQYEKSVMDSSKFCRSSALVFDVSHMCGLSLKVVIIHAFSLWSRSIDELLF